MNNEKADYARIVKVNETLKTKPMRRHYEKFIGPELIMYLRYGRLSGVLVEDVLDDASH